MWDSGWLEPSAWDIAEREAREQNSFARLVASAIANGGAPVGEDQCED